MACCHSPEMLDIKMLSFEGKLQKQIWYVYYSFKDSLKNINVCNNQMDLITQRNQQAFPEGPANHMCLSATQIYLYVPTVIITQKW
jgi:hypothetical protein